MIIMIQVTKALNQNLMQNSIRMYDLESQLGCESLASCSLSLSLSIYIYIYILLLRKGRPLFVCV